MTNDFNFPPMLTLNARFHVSIIDFENNIKISVKNEVKQRGKVECSLCKVYEQGKAGGQFNLLKKFPSFREGGPGECSEDYRG